MHLKVDAIEYTKMIINRYNLCTKLSHKRENSHPKCWLADCEFLSYFFLHLLCDLVTQLIGMHHVIPSWRTITSKFFIFQKKRRKIEKISGDNKNGYDCLKITARLRLATGILLMISVARSCAFLAPSQIQAICLFKSTGLIGGAMLEFHRWKSSNR